MKLIYFLSFLLIILLGASLAALNAEPVLVNYYFGESRLPLSFLIAIVLAVGGLLGVMSTSTWLFSEKMKNRALRKQIKMTQQELANLRTLPLQDGR